VRDGRQAAAFTVGFLAAFSLCTHAPGRTKPDSAAAPDWAVPPQDRGKIISRRLRRFPEKLIALTFDDGPDAWNTPRILSALAEHKAHATFFVLGSQAKRHPDLLRRIAAGGNVIGNHSYSHPARGSAAQAQRELDDTEKIILKAVGRKPTCFRPPYGITGNSLARLARRRGYAVITWTISAADTRPIGPAAIANNIIHTPDPGDIALMHDGPGHRATAEAVPAILDQLKKAGYRFVTVPELLRAWEKWRVIPGRRGAGGSP
jgi:peptidoglycan/xylan/chitin deacetylase (PgdA/CDA1 family)